ncbi:MAG: glycosyltransferase [candidate division WOR-3 bacterium]|nr:MAG: glycosyltransferase [candidate division WOR-3 bacterium]
MKVMFGTFSAASILGGGVAVQTTALAHELRKLGVEVELFDPWRRYELQRYDIFHLFAAHVGTYHLGRAVKTLGLKLAVSPTVFSRHSPRTVAAMLAVSKLLRRRGGLWTEHMFCQELCDMADLVLPNTQAEANFVRGAFGVPSFKIRVIHNGVDPRFADSKPDAFVDKYGISDFLLYVGHIGWGRKNVASLLSSIADLRFQTALVGKLIDNEYGRRCAELIRANERVLHVPELPAESGLLESAYAAARALVLPSQYETPGLAALEAALAGANVCITKHGGTIEYFGDYATYLDPASERSIRRAVAAAMTKPKGEELRNRIVSNFLWEEAARELLAAYRELGGAR